MQLINSPIEELWRFIPQITRSSVIGQDREPVSCTSLFTTYFHKIRVNIFLMFSPHFSKWLFFDLIYRQNYVCITWYSTAGATIIIIYRNCMHFVLIICATFTIRCTKATTWRMSMLAFWIVTLCFGEKYCLHFQGWRWMQYVPPKRWNLSTSPHGVKKQTTNIDIFTAVTISILYN
jgi:hypothetical protein